MHWIVQNNLRNEEVADRRLIETLERFNIPHTEVKVVPFSDGLPIEERIIPVVNPEGLVMVSGSIGLSKIAKSVGWFPGSFHNDDHDYQVWKKHYGDHLLNADAKITRFGDVENDWDQFFIRPCADGKTFSGQCLDWVEFKDWQRRVIDLKETYTTLDADTLVMYCPIKTIYREARFFVVDGKVVTQSTYKIGDRMKLIEEVPPTMAEYAQRMVDLWCPARAFVIDIALTDDADDGFNKVIEINGINASGFYEIDIQKFVMAIEAMEF